MRIYPCPDDKYWNVRKCSGNTLCHRDDCDTRYVRADVAIRHARAEARKAYEYARSKAPEYIKPYEQAVQERDGEEKKE